MTSLNDLFRASRSLGGSPVFAQGAGGNTSVKNGWKMYVKASGFLLKDMRAGRGYVCSDFRAMENYLKKLPARRRYGQSAEDAFNALIEEGLIRNESFGVPSIETGTHAVLGRAVIHTHNVYANVFGCMKGGDQRLAEIFKGYDFLYLPYRNPGLALSKALFEENKRRGAKGKKNGLPEIIFLANHGLLTHASTMDAALALTLDVNKKLLGYLKKNNIAPFRVGKKPADLSHHLFPDSVVYSQVDFKKLPREKQMIFYEISSAANYILAAIRRLGGVPTFIPGRDVSFIKGMGKEKHRIAMLHK